MLPDDQDPSGYRVPNQPGSQPDFRVRRASGSRGGGGLSSLTGAGSIRLFQVFGITVFLHWSWFLVAVYEIEQQKGMYHAIFWNIAEYLTLFLIVLLHEFGHALACRSVGGKADRIVLWPLGGVAFVDPPPRPGAMLWSIAAGPLVNVLLLPITWLLFAHFAPPGQAWFYVSHRLLPHDDISRFFCAIFFINAGLLVFNMIPIYPLDGGQILQSLLWFIIGRAWSLMVAACVGLAGAAVVLALAAYFQSIWFAVLAFFGGSVSYQTLKSARELLKVEKAPRRPDAECPNCHAHPPMIDLWTCGNCALRFDIFATGGVCPRCSQPYQITTCLTCKKPSRIADWRIGPAPVPQPPPIVITPLQPPWH